MRKFNVCTTKVPYASFLEAELAAHDIDLKDGGKLAPYRCDTNPRHYHLAHTDPKQSKGLGRVKKYRRCPWCKQIYRRHNLNDQWAHFNKRCLK